MTSFKLYVLFILTLCLVLSSQSKTTKNIILFAFPGGKSHTFIFIELLKYTTSHLKLDNPNLIYKFHIIVHNYDIKLWDNLSIDKQYYQIYGFGTTEEYDKKFIAAMNMAKEDPIFGYNNFNSAMVFINIEFLKSNLISKLTSLQIKFDLIITDVVNLIAPLLRRELHIGKMMYFNPTCIYTWVMPNIEYNAAFEPVIGTTFSDNMNFFERILNFAFKKGTDFMYNGFILSQNKPFIEKGYSPLDPFQANSLFLNQCINGIHFPLSLPPNVIPVGAVLPKPATKLTDERLNSFLSKYKQNIYVSQGTITRAMNVEQLINIFKEFPNIGFIFSMRKDMIYKGEMPLNVLRMSWVDQNSLLGDERVKVFITHGGLNSILESIYHAKPMIVIGLTIDQLNNAVLAREKRYGIAFTKEKEISAVALKDAIKEILTNKIYEENIQRGSKIIKDNDGKKAFYYWINYVIENGYEHLVIPGIINYKSFQLFNLDIISAIGIFLVMWMIINIFLFKLIISCFSLKH